MPALHTTYFDYLYQKSTVLYLTDEFSIALFIQPMWLCKKLVTSGDESKGWSVEYAVVEDLLHHHTYHIHAKIFVLAAGKT